MRLFLIPILTVTLFSFGCGSKNESAVPPEHSSLKYAESTSNPSYCGWVTKVEERPMTEPKAYMSYAVTFSSPMGARVIRVDRFVADDNQIDQARIAEMTDSLICLCKLGPQDDPRNSKHQSWVRSMDIRKIGPGSSAEAFAAELKKAKFDCGESN